MRGIDVISKLDSLQPNQYDTEQKLTWLSALDGELFREVILTHENPPERVIDRARESGDGELYYPPYETGEETLIVAPPYCESLYLHYLQSMVALENAEPVKYSQYAGQYNRDYLAWSGFYNRSRLPAQNEKGNRFRF